MRGRVVGVCVLAGICCALVAVGVGRLGFFGHVADGDPARGTYVQDAGLADRAAAAVEELTDGPGAEGAPDAGTRPLGGTVPAEGAAGGSGAGGGWRASEPLEARTAPTEPAIGALFSPGLDWDGEHHCSGSVVHSPGGDLVVTAAHCVYQSGFRTNLAFVPGYRDGAAPYGVWVPTRIEVDPRWVESADPDHDVAFVRVRRAGQPGLRLEDATGSHPVGFRPELPAPARLVGYPNDAEQPLGCANTAEAAGPTQLRLDCADVPNGTSGGPVLSAAGTLIGVIGGRDGGGDEVTSYSSYFGEDTRALYERAVRD
ncbi:serine protease [Streptomyces sp. NBC_00249]|uniref:trypsin-like serine peptidase n=1 Tax=Streptomyces sp. NBC_00249 TaxID=2975690 RepID=UPI0022551A2B|nr:trypsin-like peptidase domain-containing protein [Streptomyces sp. NBC_00249]MCX5193627.1 serine protease [Streptomyces sp. NBC_00249]